MTRLVAIATCTLALAAAGCGDDDNPTAPTDPNPPVVFSAQLSAANEVPPVTNAESGARGTATITFNLTRDAAGTITGGTVNFNASLNSFPANSSAILAHIHEGASGVNGPVRVNVGLSAASPVAMPSGTGTITATAVPVEAGLAQQIVANPAGYYFNVHTPVNPGGAVRGQLVRQ